MYLPALNISIEDSKNGTEQILWAISYWRGCQKVYGICFGMKRICL